MGIARHYHTILAILSAYDGEMNHRYTLHLFRRRIFMQRSFAIGGRSVDWGPVIVREPTIEAIADGLAELVATTCSMSAPNLTGGLSQWEIPAAAGVSERSFVRSARPVSVTEHEGRYDIQRSEPYESGWSLKLAESVPQPTTLIAVARAVCRAFDCEE